MAMPRHRSKGASHNKSERVTWTSHVLEGLPGPQLTQKFIHTKMYARAHMEVYRGRRRQARPIGVWLNRLSGY
jgi:hypothetical protein